MTSFASFLDASSNGSPSSTVGKNVGWIKAAGYTLMIQPGRDPNSTFEFIVFGGSSLPNFTCGYTMSHIDDVPKLPQLETN